MYAPRTQVSCNCVGIDATWFLFAAMLKTRILFERDPAMFDFGAHLRGQTSTAVAPLGTVACSYIQRSWESAVSKACS